MGRIRSFVGRHRAATVVAVTVAVAATVFGIAWFEPHKLFVDDRVMCVLPFITRRALSLTGKPGAPDELRLAWILQIEDLDDDVAEARLAGGRIEIAGILRPPSFVRAHDEGAAASRPARIRRRACDLGHE